MLKNALFFGKKCKNRRSFGDSAPKPPLASGGWGPPPDPKLLLRYLFQLI